MSRWIPRAFALVVFLATGATLHAEEFSLGMYRLTLPDGFVNEPGKGYDTLLGVFRSADGKMRAEYSLEWEYNGAQASPVDADKTEVYLTPMGEGIVRHRNTTEGVFVDFRLPPDLKLSCQAADGAMPGWFKKMLESMTSSEPAMVSMAKSLTVARREDDGKGLMLSLKKDIVPIPGKTGETCQLVGAEVVGAGHYEFLNVQQSKLPTMTLDAQLVGRQALIMRVVRRHPKGTQQHRVRIAIPALLAQQDAPAKP